jgi:hypothetical protein
VILAPLKYGIDDFQNHAPFVAWYLRIEASLLGRDKGERSAKEDFRSPLESYPVPMLF